MTISEAAADTAHSDGFLIPRTEFVTSLPTIRDHEEMRREGGGTGPADARG